MCQVANGRVYLVYHRSGACVLPNATRSPTLFRQGLSLTDIEELGEETRLTQFSDGSHGILPSRRSDLGLASRNSTGNSTGCMIPTNDIIPESRIMLQNPYISISILACRTKAPMRMFCVVD